jgi:hypothetical protein
LLERIREGKAGISTQRRSSPDKRIHWPEVDPRCGFATKRLGGKMGRGELKWEIAKIDNGYLFQNMYYETAEELLQEVVYRLLDLGGECWWYHHDQIVVVPRRGELDAAHCVGQFFKWLGKHIERELEKEERCCRLKKQLEEMCE